MAPSAVRPALLAILATVLLTGTARAGWDIELVDLYTQRYDPGGYGPRAANFVKYEKVQAVCAYRYAEVGSPDEYRPWSGLWIVDGSPQWPGFQAEAPDPVGTIHRVVLTKTFWTTGQHHIRCELNHAKPGLPEKALGNNDRTITVTILSEPVKVRDTGKAGAEPAAPRIPPGPITAGIPGPKSGMQAIPPGARPELVFDAAVAVGGVQGQWKGTITVGESAADSRGNGVCSFLLKSAVRNAGQLSAPPFSVVIDAGGQGSMGFSGLGVGGTYGFGLGVKLRPGPNTVTFRLVRENATAGPNEKAQTATVTVKVVGSCIGMLPPAPSPTPLPSRK